MCYDQVMLGIRGRLDVVADHAGALSAGRHGARIGIGQQDLAVSCGLDLPASRPENLHLLAQARDLLPEPRRARLGDVARLAVGPVQRRKITADARLDLRQARLDLGGGKVRVAVIDRLELAAVDGDDGVAEQVQPTAKHHELCAGGLDCRTVILAEVGQRLEVGHQPTGQPDQLNVALALAFEAPARWDAVEVAVEIDLEQDRRMVGGTARCLWNGAREGKRCQIELIDEHFDEANRIVAGDIVVQAIGKQRDLLTVLTCDEALHPDLRDRNLLYQISTFSHSLHPSRTFRRPACWQSERL